MDDRVLVILDEGDDMVGLLQKIGFSGLCVLGSSCCSWSYPIQDDSLVASSPSTSSAQTALEDILESVYCIRVSGVDSSGEAFTGYGSGFVLSSLSNGTLLTTSAHVVGVPVGSTNVSYSIVDNRTDTVISDDIALRVIAIDVGHDTSVLYAPVPLHVATHLRMGVDLSFKVGDDALIVGFPLGIDKWVTKGIIADVYPDSYVLDINVNFGNSGGLAITPLKDGSYVLIGQVKACLAQQYIPECREFGVIQRVHTLVPFWDKYRKIESF